MHIAEILAGVNWVATFAATVSAFVLGGLWYSKALFGNAWLQEVGLSEKAVANASMARTFGGTFVLQFVAAMALSAITPENSSWLVGLHNGLWVGLLWIATAYGITYLFEQRSLRLWLINAGFYVVLYSLMGAIIGWIE